MKKFLAMSAILLSVIILQMPQASAKDVYVGEWEGGWKAYLMPETFDLGKSGSNTSILAYCTIKTISPRSTVKYIDYTFTIPDDLNRYSISFVDSTGARGAFYLKDPGVYLVEHRVATLIIKFLASYKG